MGNLITGIKQKKAWQDILKALTLLALSAACVFSSASPANADLTNTATVSGTLNGNTLTFGSSTQSIPVVAAAPAIALVKTSAASDSNNSGAINAGDTVAYSFVVHNLGNVTLSAISVTDNKVSPVTCPATTLAPQANITCTAPAYVITQADMDAGQISNSAVAAGTAPNGRQVTDTSDPTTPSSTANAPTITPLPASRQMTLVSTATLVGRVEAGSVINYTFKITNTGTVTVKNITLTDTASTVAGGPQIASLAPGAIDDKTFTATHVLTAEDIAAGSYTNNAIASGDPMPTGSTRISTNGPVTIQLPYTASMTLTGSGALASTAAPPKAGDIVNYTFTVRNTGNVALTNIVVNDQLLAMNDNPGQQRGFALLQGLRQGPGTPDEGQFATASLGSGGPQSGIVEAAQRAAGHKAQALPQVNSGLVVQRSLVRMSGKTGPLQAGEKIGFIFTLTNSGDVPLTDITIAQPDSFAFGSALSLLNPNETEEAAIVFTRELSAEEALAGEVKSNAYVLYHVRGREVLQVLTDALSLSDIKAYDDITTAAVTPASVPKLLPGESHDFTSPVALKQSDIDNALADNKAQATAVDPARRVVRSTDEATHPQTDITVPLQRSPALGVVKTATLTMANGKTAQPGDIITYRFVVSNLGNVTLTAVSVTDDRIGYASGDTGSLSPGTTRTLTAPPYHLTAADIEAGKIDNQARASGTPPGTGATPITALTGPADPKVPGVTSLPLASPAIALKLQATVEQASPTAVHAGDKINYKFIVKNTGNNTLNNVVVADPLLSAAPHVLSGGPLTTLAKGATDDASFTGKYTITQADVDAGQVSNTATVTARDNPGTQVSDTSDPDDFALDRETVTTITAVPAISVVLMPPTWVDTNNDQMVDAGDVITYRVKVKNTGNVTLSNIITSNTDPSLTSTHPNIAGPLAPGAEDTSVTYTHTLTGADANRGYYDAQMTANADAAGRTPSSVQAQSGPADPSRRFDLGNAAIAVLKTFVRFEDAQNKPVTMVRAGDKAVYKITLRNMGTTDFTNVQVTELASYQANAQVVANGAGPFPLAANTINDTYFTVRQTVTNADIVAGAINNQVSAIGLYTFGTTPNVKSKPDLSDPTSQTGDAVTTTPITRVSSLSLIKTATLTSPDNNNANYPGDVITYNFTIKNTGNLAMTNVTLTDAPLLAAGGTIKGNPIAQLAAGASDTTTYTASYVIKQADIDAGKFANQATVKGTPEVGDEVSVLSDFNNPPAATPQPTVVTLSGSKTVLSKTAARSQVKRGEVVPYTIIANYVGKGPFTISDIMPPGFAYVNGSAMVGGTAVKPVSDGQSLNFNGLKPTDGKIILTLNLRTAASLSTGKFVNKAQLISAATGRVLGQAEATVEVMPEAVFDCSDIIGRVFDDLNGNGYMNDGEPGLPGVRLVTLNGVLITTDAKGKYHVPCAAIPDSAIGSNYLLKLDTRSLPMGYKVTTENPRDVRVTRGKVTILNFGAAKTREMKAEFSANAFDPGTADITEQWSPNVDKLIKVLRARKATLTLVYHAGAESDALTRARVKSMSELVQQAWGWAGPAYPLNLTISVEKLTK